MNEREDNRKNIVVGHYCDVQMAEKKGFLPCDHNCKKCVACILIRENGDKEHR